MSTDAAEEVRKFPLKQRPALLENHRTACLRELCPGDPEGKPARPTAGDKGRKGRKDKTTVEDSNFSFGTGARTSGMDCQGWIKARDGHVEGSGLDPRAAPLDSFFMQYVCRGHDGGRP
ncbi:hypothetical protein KM043_005885 [Ampulex compressa]|nr:hypothetical protein KM043_005885 [Ampulex compressa]